MHLAEILRRRPIAASGVFLAITRRCPLTCRHCSTSSLMTSEQGDETLFEKFVESFTPACHPDLVLLTGGEPLLRPALVARLAESARAVGTGSYAITSLFAATARSLPAAQRHAIAALDHLAVSLDVFHEEQVPRERVFAAVHRARELGPDVSFQITGSSPDDPYLDDVLDAIATEFDGQVPALVGTVASAGRARQWLPSPSAASTPSTPSAARVEQRAAPCLIAAWPVVGYDGTVTACANQDVVDHRPLPDHLRLGHAAEDDWATIRSRCLGSPVLRALRTVGPLALADRAGASYCATCWQLPASVAASDAASEALHTAMAGLSAQLGAVGFARQYGSPRHASRVLAGA
jgi:pyruvate-formate lyase-activating enzyme